MDKCVADDVTAGQGGVAVFLWADGDRWVPESKITFSEVKKMQKERQHRVRQTDAGKRDHIEQEEGGVPLKKQRKANLANAAGHAASIQGDAATTEGSYARHQQSPADARAGSSNATTPPFDGVSAQLPQAPASRPTARKGGKGKCKQEGKGKGNESNGTEGGGKLGSGKADKGKSTTGKGQDSELQKTLAFERQYCAQVGIYKVAG